MQFATIHTKFLGGNDGSNDLNSSEFLSLSNGSQPGPQLQYGISFHCVIKIDPKTALVIGGLQDGVTSKDTWIINLANENNSFKKGPSLKMGRRLMSCGKMSDSNGKSIFVVTGGKDQSGATLDSTEILHSLEGSWNFGILIFVLSNSS